MEILLSAWMCLWTTFWSIRRPRGLIFKFAVTTLWSKSRLTVGYALHFRIKFLHFPLSKIRLICVLWMPSGCSHACVWFFLCGWGWKTDIGLLLSYKLISCLLLSLVFWWYEYLPIVCGKDHEKYFWYKHWNPQEQ